VIEILPGRIAIEAPIVSERLTMGGSMAVNGACLTVIDRQDETFWADVVPETLERTNLGGLRPGDEVNLEPPLRLEQGVDGHLVQGHVDGTAAVLEVREVELGRMMRIELPAHLAHYVVEKGSIAVDGVSLTVSGLDEDSFTVALIPHTLRETIAGSYHRGRVVNLEVDLIARYVERLLQRRRA
jgi:riboflavin synthase